MADYRCAIVRSKDIDTITKIYLENQHLYEQRGQQINTSLKNHFPSFAKMFAVKAGMVLVEPFSSQFTNLIGNIAVMGPQIAQDLSEALQAPALYSFATKIEIVEMHLFDCGECIACFPNISIKLFADAMSTCLSVDREILIPFVENVEQEQISDALDFLDETLNTALRSVYEHFDDVQSIQSNEYARFIRV